VSRCGVQWGDIEGQHKRMLAPACADIEGTGEWLRQHVMVASVRYRS